MQPAFLVFSKASESPLWVWGIILNIAHPAWIFGCQARERCSPPRLFLATLYCFYYVYMACMTLAYLRVFPAEIRDAEDEEIDVVGGADYQINVIGGLIEGSIGGDYRGWFRLRNPENDYSFGTCRVTITPSLRTIITLRNWIAQKKLIVARMLKVSRSSDVNKTSAWSVTRCWRSGSLVDYHLRGTFSDRVVESQGLSHITRVTARKESLFRKNVIRLVIAECHLVYVRTGPAGPSSSLRSRIPLMVYQERGALKMSHYSPSGVRLAISSANNPANR
ncbi:uncharacterized protein BT62DRAFT_990302 [Guyanagaster necrorhizus]|uniref:Uncharacterized protein n=1 Tax=Guyanagaster necrorhizus TaxID=856835 RepID=A0A9P7W3J1_9AGAR|nr:uncharacterized protein BT62DRAFT_990302 [Guyanagaster necrorhizus MCA 3950]KAG7451914.1 hypothetical protein BT62DRAFT_990302 [Guyanagaster necrorhizus MCA 3950]